MPAEPTHQGQIWNLVSRISGRRATVVIVDSDVVIRQRPMLVAAPVREAREVPSRHQLLTVAMPESSQVIALYDIAIVPKDSLTEQVGELTSELLEQVKIGLRARFDL
ncbi:type II toxin-antitoxin system PemK/MazF family toxin [Nocardia sp. NPDC050630]|uniref:type II toxin-antitoxin system PemK/MazF family toxin n=1 Tax=unclassified Nocardia TaxID=2637762 RepID=UPI0037951B27